MKLTKTNDTSLIASLNEPVQNLHHELYPDLFKPCLFWGIKLIEIYS